MKRFLCLFLSIVIIIGLSACVGDAPNNIDSDIQSSNQSKNESSKNNENNSNKSDLQTQSESSSQSSSPNQSTNNQNDNSSQTQSNNQAQNNTSSQSIPAFSLGKAEGNTYKNEFLELSCSIPSGWRFYSDQEILKLNNFSADAITDPIIERLKDYKTIYMMAADNQTEGSSISIVLEKHGALNLKQTLEMQIHNTKKVYENQGYTDINILYQKTDVNGKNYDSLVTTAKIYGIDFYSTVFVFKKDNFLAYITVTSLFTDKTAEILGYFDVK